MNYSRFRDVFRDAARRCAAIAANGGWLEQEVARQAAMIRASALEDTNKAYRNDRFEQEIAWMLTFAKQRSGQVYRQVGAP